MSALDWSQCSAVESIPGKVSGAWVFKGTRTPASVVFEHLEDGLTVDEVIEQFGVTREQVQAVLEFAASTRHQPMRVLFDNGARLGVSLQRSLATMSRKLAPAAGTS